MVVQQLKLWMAINMFLSFYRFYALLDIPIEDLTKNQVDEFQQVVQDIEGLAPLALS